MEITESDTDYVVSCIKHVFPQHIVFQFNVTNNMDGHVLENVQVEMEAEKEEWQEEVSAAPIITSLLPPFPLGIDRCVLALSVRDS